MPFLIDTRIDPDQAAARERVRPKHIAYLQAQAAHLLAAGAKLHDDGSVAPGSFYLVDVETRDAAEAFLAADPYAVAGLIVAVSITRVRQGFFDRRQYRAPESAT